jgi:PmbA protein
MNNIDNIDNMDHVVAWIPRILDTARKHGATQAEAVIQISDGFQVDVRQADVESVLFHQNKGVSITVYQGHQKGSVSTTDLTERALEHAVVQACGLAKQMSPDPYVGLADPGRMAYGYPDLDLSYPWDLTVPQAIALGIACEAAGLAHDKALRSDSVTVSTQRAFGIYGNSHGFVGSYPSTRHSLSCALIAEHSGEMQRDDWYTQSRLSQQLQDPTAVGREAARRTLARLKPRSIATQRVPVLFAAEVARGLVGHCIQAISGGALYRRASFLCDQKDRAVFSPIVHIDEQPLCLQGIGSAPFDAEGVKTQDRVLIDQGVLKGYMLGSYSARRLGLDSTGHAGGAHHIRVRPSVSDDLAQLLSRMGKGVLITELMGQGINLVTGDYSRGATGFWVEGGKIQYPVAEITIAGNLKEMFQGVVCVGADIDRRGSIETGSWLIDQMMVAGAE